MNPRLAIPCLALFILPACSGSPPLRTSSAVTVTELASLPAPSEQDQIGAGRRFLIGPHDKLTIGVFGAPELSGEMQVDSNGTVFVPLIGAVEATGKTPMEVAGLISGRLRTYVSEPYVTVNVRESVSQTLTVEGQVKKPGIYPVVGDMTLVRAIASAEGESDYADRGHVAIFRTVNGERMAAVYSLAAIRAGAYSDPKVYANDSIYVGESARRRLLQYALTLGPALVTPIIYVLR